MINIIKYTNFIIIINQISIWFIIGNIEERL